MFEIIIWSILALAISALGVLSYCVHRAVEDLNAPIRNRPHAYQLKGKYRP